MSQDSEETRRSAADDDSESMDEPVKIDLSPEDALRRLPTVDPNAPPAKPNADKSVPEDEPAKDHGDALERDARSQKKPRPKGAEDIYGETWIDGS